MGDGGIGRGISSSGCDGGLSGRGFMSFMDEISDFSDCDIDLAG